MESAILTDEVATNVAAIVLNWNGWRDTVECLESILACTLPPAHIVVCDNGSVDGSMHALKNWASRSGIAFSAFDTPDEAYASEPTPARLIFIENGENGGFAAGNNVAIRYLLNHSPAEFYWLLNNDAVPAPCALDRMLDTIETNPGVGMVGATLVDYHSPHLVQAVGGGYILPVVCHDTQLGRGKRLDHKNARELDLHHLIGASLLVRARAIADVGLMDESYFLYREETDWCIRMRARGWRLCCRTDATVRHKQARSIGFKSAIHDYYAVRNFLHLVRKFYPRALPAAFAYFALRSLLPKIARMQFRRARAVCAALGDFMGGIRGRAREHSDAVLRAQYVIHVAAPVRTRPSSALILLGMAIALSMVCLARVERMRVHASPGGHIFTQPIAVVRPERALGRRTVSRSAFFPVVRLVAQTARN